MNIDLSRFKVVYGERVLNAVALDGFIFDTNKHPKIEESSITKPQFITVIAIDENGNIVFITDEAWRFQFIPKMGGA